MDIKKFTQYLDSINTDHVQGRRASEFTTFRVGGVCDVTVSPDSGKKLCRTVEYCKENGIPYVIIGLGSNVVFADEGFRGAVILTSGISGLECEGSVITAEAGVHLSKVCNLALSRSLTGMEFAYGIPGSLGGAVFMNGGAYGGEMKDVIKCVNCYNTETGEFLTLNGDECEFGHRVSVFQKRPYIVLSAKIGLERGCDADIKAKMTELLQRRKDKQPLEYPSAGSAFKRYPGRYTGQMIEQAGLKGYTIGGAQVSEKHAGFIVNVGGATAADIKALTEHIKAVIKEREGVDIECEIRFIG